MSCPDIFRLVDSLVAGTGAVPEVEAHLQSCESCREEAFMIRELLGSLYHPEMEVPESYDGTVQIRGAVREAGERAKVAVISREGDVDLDTVCGDMDQCPGVDDLEDLDANGLMDCLQACAVGEEDSRG